MMFLLIAFAAAFWLYDNWKTVATIGLLGLMFATTSAHAGCISDCRDEAESEIDFCERLWSDPEEWESLSSCIENAGDGFEYCVEECGE